MNYQIADALASSFINLPYITRAAGCVDMVIEPVKKKRGKKIPVSKNVYFDNGDELVCDPDPILKRLIPRSSEKGIIYFEDMGSRIVKGTSAHIERWEGRLMLVCWLNTTKTDGMDAEAVEAQIKNLIPNEILPSGLVQAGKMYVDKTLPKRPSPFERYDYDEKETQYITHPYEYFALELRYVVYGAKGCGSGDISIEIDLPTSASSSLTMYALEETKTGLKDYDGSDIYVRGELFENSDLQGHIGYEPDSFGYDSGFNTNIGNVIRHEVSYERSKYGSWESISNNTIYIRNDGTYGIVVENHFDHEDLRNGRWFIYYTKP